MKIKALMVALVLFFPTIVFAADTNTTSTVVTDKAPPTASAPSIVINNSDICKSAASAAIQTQILGFASGITVTDRMHEIFSARSVLEGQSVESIMKNKIKEENIRRLGQPNDVASLVEFLCRPEARHINGAGIPIDGGGSKGYY